jgi:quinol monooxygenase YgiN
MLLLMAMATAHAASESSQPVYVVTYVDVLADAASKAAILLGEYRGSSRNEPGALAINVFAQHGRPSGFAIIEIWRDSTAFETHGKAAAIDQLKRGLKPLQLAPMDVRVHTPYSVGATLAPGGRAPTLLVHVDVLPSFVDEYARILKQYIEGTRGEPGLTRLDILQTLPPHTNHFTVVESWLDTAALQAHQKKTTAQTYREALPTMLGALYDERTYHMMTATSGEHELTPP